MQSVTGWQGSGEFETSQANQVMHARNNFQQIERLGGVPVICVGILTGILTRVPLTAFLRAKIIGNRVEWRKGWDSNPRFYHTPLNREIHL
jgi:hypothetical protein